MTKNIMINKKDVLDVLLDEYIKRTKSKQSTPKVKNVQKVQYVNGKLYRY